MTSNKRYKLDRVGIRMVKEPPLYSSEPVNTPDAAVRLMAETLRQYDREVFCVVNLRNDMKPINMNIVSIGTLNRSLAHPREILKSTILSNAESVMLFHNHPSGNLSPSAEDIALTDRMQKLCTLLGVPVLDHIIIGNADRYYSFREHDILSIPQIEYTTDIGGIDLKAQKVAEKSSAKYQSASDRKQSVQEITEKLEQGVHNLFESDRYKAYLSSMSKFHNYSLNNTILIALQKPDATLVAGYQVWKTKHGRQVMKGEKGIKIIAPSPYKIKQEQNVMDPDTHQPVMDVSGNPVKETVVVERPAFRIATVFDVSQTEGKELPALGVEELHGDVKNFDAFFEALKESLPVPIGFEDIRSGAKGYYHLEDKRVAIQEGMSQIQTVKTAIHEMAHAKLHSRENQRK